MNEEQLGPVDYFIVEFADGSVRGEGFAALLDRVDRGLIYVLDIEFFRRTGDGTLESVTAGDLGVVDGIDFADFDGAAAGLLDREDLDAVADRIGVGALAAVVVYEDLSMVGVLTAFGASGAHLVAEGPVDVTDLDVALNTEH